MITLKQAAAWCGGAVLPEYETVAFSGVENDSRNMKPGQLFVALKAARDGHDFIGNAMAAGATAALGEWQLPGVPMIVVPDSLTGLERLARLAHSDTLHRSDWQRGQDHYQGNDSGGLLRRSENPVDTKKLQQRDRCAADAAGASA